MAVTVPAIAVPDARHWAAVGVSLAELGYEPTDDLHSAESVLCPERLPRGLGTALVELTDALALGAVDQQRISPFGGVEIEELLSAARAGLNEEAKQEEEDEGGDHDHHDMMAVTGEPSRDGLVMEDAEATIGPLTGPFPTGLVVALTLDGDVVSEVDISSVVEDPASPLPDPFSRRACEWAMRRGSRAGLAPTDVPALLMACEIERALGHVGWIAGLCRLLGHQSLRDQLVKSTQLLIRLHRTDREQLAEAVRTADLTQLERSLERFESSRLLKRRLADVGRVDGDTSALRGPNARAGGHDEDARASDPAYLELGFRTELQHKGDAAARALVRAREVRHSLELVRRASAENDLPTGRGAIEGPRGPLEAEGARVLPDRSDLKTASLAAESTRGAELARALVALYSFDLNPWRLHR